MATRRSSTMSHQEAGRKGAEARRGKSNNSSRSGSNRESSRDRLEGNSNAQSGRNSDRSQRNYGFSSTSQGRHEVGCKGCQAVSQRYSPEFFQVIGRKARRSMGESSLPSYENRRREGSGRISREETGRRETEARWGRKPCLDDYFHHDADCGHIGYHNGYDNEEDDYEERERGCVSRGRYEERAYGDDDDLDDDEDDDEDDDDGDDDDEYKRSYSLRGRNERSLQRGDHLRREETGRRGIEGRWGRR